MGKVVELRTKRLKLRQWKDDDFSVFARMNSNPAVMEYYPSVMSETESNEMANKIRTLIENRGWGFWAVEESSTHSFIGFVGLHEPTYDLAVTPCVEIGWRLGKDYWGKGYATEAANECLKYAFEELKLNEVYSFASTQNKKSWSVMERICMVNTGQNFEHPIIPEGHQLREHVLYKITKKQWRDKAV